MLSYDLFSTYSSMVVTARSTGKSVLKNIDKFYVTRDVSSSHKAQTQVFHVAMFFLPSV